MELQKVKTTDTVEEGWRQKQRQRSSPLFEGGGGFIKFLAALAVLPRSIWKNRINSTFALSSLSNLLLW